MERSYHSLHRTPRPCRHPRRRIMAHTAPDALRILGSPIGRHTALPVLLGLRHACSLGLAGQEDTPAMPVPDTFRDHGYDWMRLRLFLTPDRLPNDLDDTIELAREAKDMGYRFLLDHHDADCNARPVIEVFDRFKRND